MFSSFEVITASNSKFFVKHSVDYATTIVPTKVLLEIHRETAGVRELHV